MTALELLALIANGGILIGAGAGGLVYGLRRQKAKNGGSNPPSPKPEREPWADRTGRFDVVQQGLDECKRRLDSSEERYESMAAVLSDVRIDVAELRTEVRLAMGMGPPPVRRGGAAR